MWTGTATRLARARGARTEVRCISMRARFGSLASLASKVQMLNNDSQSFCLQGRGTYFSLLLKDITGLRQINTKIMIYMGHVYKYVSITDISCLSA